MHDPLWKDASFHWHKIKKQLDAIATTTTAIIIEPIVQGAGCMKIYSANFLKRLADWAKKHDIHIIADEIMTGLGRTGKMLASEHANIQPDFICLSKALTAGWLPLSAVLTTHKIFNTFYEDDTSGKTFFHSHTFSGNALAVSTALATLEIIEKEKLNQRANTLQKTMMQHLLDINQKTGKLKNLRGIGAIVAADLTQHPTKNRIGYDLFKEAVKLGALIRPIGNTLYWLPPLNIKTKTLETLKEVTLNAINNIY